MSTGMNISEKTITSVIDHQFTALLENMPTCNSLEMSGFGKFMFHKNKAPKAMTTLLFLQEKIKGSLPDLSPQVRKRAEVKLSQIEMEIKALNQKLQSYENQFCTDIRGLEKLPHTPRRNKRTNIEGGSPQDKDL